MNIPNTYFDDIIGNDQVKSYLTNMIRSDKLGSSLLFAGLEGIGKSLFAKKTAQLVLQATTLVNHPDFYEYRPEGKLGLHSIESMRQMCEKVYQAPFSSAKKLFIVHHAERMLPPSANSMLKTFEEPGKDSIILLLSDNPAALLPTILSRCRMVRFCHIHEADIAGYLINHFNKSEEEAKVLAHSSGGSLGKACRLATDESDLIRKEVLNILKTGKVKYYKEIIDAAKTISDLVEEVKKQEEAKRKEAPIKKETPNDLTAAQQHYATKEMDAFVSLKQTDFSHSIFDLILSWYRDLHLLKHSGSPTFLMNPDCVKELENRVKEPALLSPILSIEAVQKMIAEAKLLLERSTSLHIVLENLFLKLGLI